MCSIKNINKKKTKKWAVFRLTIGRLPNEILFCGVIIEAKAFLAVHI